MSTKIYNGFKIKNLNPKQQKQFFDSVKEKMNVYFFTGYIEMLANKIVEFLDLLSELDYKMEFDRLETAFASYYKSSSSSIYLFKSALYDKDTSVDITEIRRRLSSPYTTVYSFLSDILSEDIKRGEIIRDILHIDADVLSEIVMFPITNKNILLMTYSDRFTDFFQTLCNDKEFVEQYGLMEYHYQNQTDKPDAISNRDWLKRKHDWDKALPSGIPAKDGIVVKLSDADSFMSFLFSQRTKVVDLVMEKLPLRSKRIKNASNNKALDKYWENYIAEHKLEGEISYHETMSAIREFKEKVRIGDYDTLKLIKEQEDLACEYIPDITKENLSKQPVINWFPNYKNSIKEE